MRRFNGEELERWHALARITRPVPSVSFFVDLFRYLILFWWLAVLDKHGLIRVLVGADLADDHFDPESRHAVLEYRFSETMHTRGSILD